MDYESLEFPEAIKRLADRARIPLQFDNDPKYQEKQFLKDKLLDIHEQVTQRWHNCLCSDAAGAKARDYLKERGVSEDAIQLFRLGYAPDSWDDSVNWAKSKGFDLPLVEQSGLIGRKEGSERYYSRFRDRLMFPICDEQGRVIGFSGRILPGDEDPRKYVNSPETPLFTKSRVMFGLEKSKRALLEKQYAIICEGQLDLIACFMAGVQNVVAPQGTALTRDHTRILKRYVSEVILCFDSDEAGQKAAVRALDDVLGSGLAVRVASIPAPDDPDSFIKKHGAAAFEALVQKAEGFFDYYLNRLCHLHDIRTDKGQKLVLSGMAEAVAKTNDPALFDKYAQKTAARLGVSMLSSGQAFKSAMAKPTSTMDGAASEESPDDDGSWKPGAQEFWFLKIILLEDETLEWVRTHVSPDWVQNSIVREIVQARLRQDSDGEEIQAAAIFRELQSPRARSLITEALAETRSIPNPRQQLMDLATRLRNTFLDKQMAGIMQSISTPGIAAEESTRLLRERLALQAIKRGPLQPLEQSV
jgi:DNA primase